MQKLKKKFVVLSVIFLFSSCAGVKKPLIEICSHDQPAYEVECFDNQNQTHRTLDIKETDKYIMFSPNDWGLILEYLGKLERKVKVKKVKKELKKIFKTNSVLKNKMKVKRNE